MSDRPIHRKCPVCDGSDIVPFNQKVEMWLVRCRTCSAFFVSPIPPEIATGEFYDRLSVPFYLSPGKLESDYAPVRFTRELKLFRRFCPSGDVLDVGCSTGAFLYQLKTRFPGQYTVTGNDVAQTALDHAQSRGVEMIRGPFPAYDFGGRQFDAITFWAVLEHLPHPRAFLAKAAEILKPGGHCFVLVPNLNSLAVMVLGTNYRYIMPDHINYFTAGTLRRMAQRVDGLERIYRTTSHFNPIVIWRDWGNEDKRVSDEERVQLLQRTTRYKQNPWLTPAKWAYNGVELLLAKIGLADNLVMVFRKTAG